MYSLKHFNLIHNQLTTVKKNHKKAIFDPNVSSPGVKKGVNNVNKPFLTPTFPVKA